MRILEQVDKSNGLFIYSWILDGVSGRKGKIRTQLENAGWKFIGNKTYVTNDYALARQTGPFVFGINFRIESNGTHEVHNAKMYSTPQEEITC